MKDLDTVIKCDDSDEADSDYDLSKEEYTNKHTVDLSFSSIQLDPQFVEMFPDEVFFRVKFVGKVVHQGIGFG